MLVGSRLGEYKILNPIGQGGMGQVFRARHLLMRRIVAIKTVKPSLLRSELIHKRFRREIEASARISHENVLTVFDAGVSNERPYLVMEYIDGDDLGAIVTEYGPLTIDDTLKFIIQAANGLEEIHKHGIVHRDVKPHNMLVSKRGILKVFDFGICKLIDASTDETSQSQPKEDPYFRSAAFFPRYLADIKDPSDDIVGTSYTDNSLPNLSFISHVMDTNALLSIANIHKTHENSIVKMVSVPWAGSAEIRHSNKEVPASDSKTSVETLSNDAEPVSSKMTKVIGTPGFISPEQINNPSQVDYRSDIYSLGCTLYFLLTGKPVVTGSSFDEVIMKHQQGNLPTLSESRQEVPKDLESVYETMIALKETDRFQSMHETIESLRDVGAKPKIFISYRRDDSLDAADRLYTSLIPKFGYENLFFDIDKIPPGIDFREYLKKAVIECDILMVIIGDNWLRVLEDGKRRIDNPADFVRLEIEYAFEFKISVVPVLVGRAQISSPIELPQSIRDLAYHNAVEVRAGQNYNSHISRLTKGILSISRRTV